MPRRRRASNLLTTSPKTPRIGVSGFTHTQTEKSPFPRRSDSASGTSIRLSRPLKTAAPWAEPSGPAAKVTLRPVPWFFWPDESRQSPANLQCPSKASSDPARHPAGVAHAIANHSSQVARLGSV